MAEISKERLTIRQIQGLAVLFSCLPAGGKCREFFTLALDSPEGAWLEKVNPLNEPESDDGDDGIKSWLEDLWNPENLSAEAKELSDWQRDPDNMMAALAEMEAVADKVSPS
ncbi:MAG: DurN family substrate-assisted peptide maturase [Solirubrobacterales bacterium]